MENKLNPKSPTDAMIFGTLCHRVVLEYEDAVGQYYIFDDTDILPLCVNKDGSKSKKPRSTDYYKAWKNQFELEHEDKILASQDDWNTAVRIRKGIQAHPKASALLAMGGHIEQSLQWEHELGVKLKGRPDFYIPDYHADYGLVVDLKITNNSSASAFSRTVGSFRYDISMANYCEGLEILTGKPYKAAFIAVEVEAPHVVMVYHMSDNDLNMAKHEIYGQVRKFKQCMESGIWHGYDETENDEIEIPVWAYQ